MKLGLVMEGGAMRGLFTAGVIDVLMENNIKFDGAIGVSAGAAFGCNYKSEQIGRVIRYNTKFIKDKRYCGLRVFLKTGNIFSTEFCYGDVPLKYDIFDFETFEKNPMEFYVVCTDIERGKPFYHKFEGRNDHGFDWIRASASMPLVSQIVEIEGKKLLDGGISDSVPLKFFQNIGYEKNVVILTQPEDYRKKKNSILPLLKIKYKKYPELVKAMEDRHIMYNSTTDYILSQEKEGKAFVIRPPEKLSVGRIEKDTDKLNQTYKTGRRIAIEKLEEIKSFLNKSE